MIKGAKSFQQKYEKIMGESSADKLWNDVKNGINEFTKKIELDKQTGIFGICILICCVKTEFYLKE